VGGSLGAVLRYAVSGQVQLMSGSAEFPYGTLAVNLIGCLVIGLLSYLVETRGLFSPEIRLMVFIGVLGAFTTYSTFANESVNLLRDGRFLMAGTYMGVHLLAGLACVVGGWALAHQIWR
jgi:CrcB protein